MAIKIILRGSLSFIILDIRNREVDRETELSIMDNLQQGEYIASITNGNIYDINDLENPLYTFELESTDDLDYDFEE